MKQETVHLLVKLIVTEVRACKYGRISNTKELLTHVQVRDLCELRFWQLDNENYSLLEYHEVYTGNLLMTLRRRLPSPSSGWSQKKLMPTIKLAKGDDLCPGQVTPAHETHRWAMTRKLVTGIKLTFTDFPS